MIASILLDLAYKCMYVLVLFGLVYPTVRYFDGQLSQRSAIKLARLIVLPTFVFLILAMFLPYRWTVWPAWHVFDHFISIWTVLIPAVVFLALWKGMALSVQRAALYTGLFIVLGILCNHIYQALGNILPPYSSREPERKFKSALIDLGMLSIPALVLVAHRLLGLRIPLWLGCFGIALLFSPVVYIAYGRLAVMPSMYTMIYLSVGDGSGLAAREVLKIIPAAISLIVPTMALMWLYGFVQKLRNPAMG